MTIRAMLLLVLIAQGALTAPARAKGKSAASPTPSPAGDTVAASQAAPSQQAGTQKGSRYTAKSPKKEVVVQTFTGTVEWEYKPLAWDCDVPNCDHFALYDDATHRNYDLDDARAALPFEGQRAKVTGTVDTKNSIIHVLRIEELKQ